MPRTYLLDTGPVFDYVLARFSEDTGRSDLLNDVRFLNTSARLAAFKRFLLDHSPSITVGSVVAEVNHVFRRHRQEAKKLKKSHGLKKADGAPFWRLLTAEYVALTINEELLRVVELNVDVLDTLGPTDSAVVTLALRYLSQHRDVAVLTGDRRLYRRCRSMQVPAEYMEQTLTRLAASAPVA